MAIHIQRREFITLLGGPAAAWPLAARAQQVGKIARIGIFAGAANPVIAAGYRAFLDELRKAGLNEGQNLVVDHRPTDQVFSSLSADAAEMIRSKVDVLVATGSEAALQAAVAASRTIPIVIVAINYDPIARGYVKSLAQPGGNVTGVVLRQPELAEKQVELLTQAFPHKTRLAVLWDAISADQFDAADRRAKALRLEVRSLRLENPPYDFDAAFQTIAASDPDMLLVQSSPFFSQHGSQIAKLRLSAKS